MKLIHSIARFLSAAFAPIFMGTYGILLTMWLSYLCYSPFKARAIVVAVTFASTCVIPVIGIFLLSKLGVVKDPMLNNRTDRTLPYILCTICYIAMAVYYYMLNAPVWMSLFMLGGAVALIVLTVVNRWWKISGHATAMGGLTGMTFFLLVSGNSPFDLEWEFIAVVLLSGLVCTSRLILEKHTLGQVAAGFLNGFVCVFLPTWLLQGASAPAF